MAGGTGRTAKIDTGGPGAGRGGLVIIVTMGGVNVSVLGLHVNFNLGMIWAQMALSAGFRLAGFHH